MVEEKAAVAAKTAAAPAAKAVPAAKTGTVLSVAKGALLSPAFGVVVLVGIIGWELWKGSKDAREFKTV